MQLTPGGHDLPPCGLQLRSKKKEVIKWIVTLAEAFYKGAGWDRGWREDPPGAIWDLLGPIAVIMEQDFHVTMCIVDLKYDHLTASHGNKS